jgi:hypothetical protein
MRLHAGHICRWYVLTLYITLEVNTERLRVVTQWYRLGMVCTLHKHVYGNIFLQGYDNDIDDKTWISPGRTKWADSYFLQECLICTMLRCHSAV